MIGELEVVGVVYVWLLVKFKNLFIMWKNVVCFVDFV